MKLFASFRNFAGAHEFRLFRVGAADFDYVVSGVPSPLPTPQCAGSGNSNHTQVCEIRVLNQATLRTWRRPRQAYSESSAKDAPRPEGQANNGALPLNLAERLSPPRLGCIGQVETPGMHSCFRSSRDRGLPG